MFILNHDCLLLRDKCLCKVMIVDYSVRLDRVRVWMISFSCLINNQSLNWWWLMSLFNPSSTSWPMGQSPGLIQLSAINWTQGKN